MDLEKVNHEMLGSCKKVCTSDICELTIGIC